MVYFKLLKFFDAIGGMCVMYKPLRTPASYTFYSHFPMHWSGIWDLCPPTEYGKDHVSLPCLRYIIEGSFSISLSRFSCWPWRSKQPSCKLPVRRRPDKSLQAASRSWEWPLANNQEEAETFNHTAKGE